MTRYRKKPVEVEAWQVGSDEPMPKCLEGKVESLRDGYRIKASSYSTRVSKGDYIIIEGDGLRCIKKRHFEQTYEVVE